MQARMKNPAIVLGAFEPAQALYQAAYTSGLDQATVVDGLVQRLDRLERAQDHGRVLHPCLHGFLPEWSHQRGFSCHWYDRA